MSTHDTSKHQVRHSGEETVGSLKNGSVSNNDNMSFPQHHSLKHHERQYMPTTIDPEREASEGDMHGSPC